MTSMLRQASVGAAHDLARSVARHLEDRLGVDVLPRRYWSPIPSSLPDTVWDAPSLLAGLTLDLPGQTRLLDRLRPLMPAETDPLTQSSWYGGDDARTLYAIIRHLRPKRVVELGSGHSTEIIRAATARDRLEMDHRVFDPFPGFTGPQLEMIEPVAATDVRMDVFAALDPGDVLFVDTTHTVKTGGDVNRVILDVLPTLRPGVWVHFHDIFLPYEYPREWVLEKHLYWAEQYLLQAFLAFNRAFEVRLACHALARAGKLSGRPGAFWIERVDGAGAPVPSGSSHPR